MASGSASRVGQADVFAGEDDDAARDETEVFAGVEHFREPVDGALLVGGAHAFDEGADGVVVGVALSVVDDGFLLNAVLGDGEGEVDDGVLVAGRTSVVGDAGWGQRPEPEGASLGRRPPSAFRHLRASPSASLARWVRASASICTL